MNEEKKNEVLSAIYASIRLLEYAITAIQDEKIAVRVAKPKQAKKASRVKKSQENVWTLDEKKRGPVPKWVLMQTGAKNKADLLLVWKNKTKFVEGAAVPAPPK